MKTFVALAFVVLILANAALVGLLYYRSEKPAEVATTPVPPPKSITSAEIAAAVSRALASGKPEDLFAIGFSDREIRALQAGLACAKFALQAQIALQSKAEDGRYWRHNLPARDYTEQRIKQRLAVSKARNALDAVIHTLYGGVDFEDQYFGAGTDFLPREKIAGVKQIEQDYADMAAEIRAEQNWVKLSSDQAKLRLLEEEKKRDLEALLSPAEREQYDLHLSPTALRIRVALGDAIETEESYKKIFALQRAFDAPLEARTDPEQPFTPEEMQAQAAAQHKLYQDIQAVIGESNYSAYVKQGARERDPDRQALASLRNRLELPGSAIDQVLSSRDSYAAQTQLIANNPSLSEGQRSAQIKALSQRAEAEINSSLGTEGGEAFSKRSQWLDLMRAGSAFSADAPDFEARDNPLMYYGDVVPFRANQPKRGP